jgi:hypothetical protein
MNKIFLTIFGIVCIAALAYGSIHYFKKETVSDISPSPALFADQKNDASQSTSSPFSSTPGVAEAASNREIPEGYKEYRDTTFRFSLLYPNDLMVKKYEEGGGAATITFQDIHTAQGFQLFITPYQGQQVTAAQFKKDIPSGIRNAVTTTVIDGAVGAAFVSSNALLGETREIWFIHNGYLYEATTLKPLDVWFSPIMQSWKFI